MVCGEISRKLYGYTKTRSLPLTLTVHLPTNRTGVTMRFNVPFIPDREFAAFLNARAGSLHSCYFSLYSELIYDARHKHQIYQVKKLTDALGALEVPKKYLLINSRIHAPGQYFDRSHLRTVVKILTDLQDAGFLDGIVYADAYFLQALSNAGGERLSRVEAVPSVNCMLDTFDKILSVLDFIGGTNFKTPGTLILDRSLNRRMGALAEVSAKCREKFPEIKLELLANEGCLFQCPFKAGHDCLISVSNMGKAVNTFEVNQELGCMQYIAGHPSQVLKSPFIRPEDVGAYEEYVDVLKICGRTLGSAFLARTIDAYLRRTYPGNLFGFLDAMGWMAAHRCISNEKLPPGFQQQLSTCSKDCTSCLYCEQIMDHFCEKVEGPVPNGLPRPS